MLRLSSFFALTLFLIQGAMAESDQPDLSRLKAALNNVTPQSVVPAPLPGMYEVIADGHILYLSEDGRFVIEGDMVDLVTQDNITETRRSGLRSEAITKVGVDNMVVFPAKESAKHSVAVFTDIDCAYCRKLHKEMASYNEQGIEIRYLMFPRAGVGSDSYDKAVSVWCADDQLGAMTKAKRGEVIEEKTCPNPVKQHFELGRSLGVSGTPSMILDDGQMVPGYVPAARLAKMLEAGAQAN